MAGKISSAHDTLKAAFVDTVKSQLDDKILPRMASQSRWWAATTLLLLVALAAGGVWARRKYNLLKKSHLL